VRRRLGVVISLDFDDDSAASPNHQAGADQLGRDFMNGAVEEFAGKPLGTGHF
jgi:hypothetical protein